jgi:hypothetical protein
MLEKQKYDASSQQRLESLDGEKGGQGEPSLIMRRRDVRVAEPDRAALLCGSKVLFKSPKISRSEDAGSRQSTSKTAPANRSPKA